MQTPLTDDPKQLKVFISELTKENELLREQVKLLKHYRFSSHTENLISPGQLPLLNQELQEYHALIKQTTESISVKSHHRKPKQRIGFDESLPVEKVILDLSESQKTCDCCQGSLTQISAESTKKVEYVPASVKVIDYVRLKYACKHCQQTIKRAELPQFILPKTMAMPSLLAHIFVSKFADHQPYNRIETQLKRQNIYLPKQTMSAWGIKLEEKIQPLKQVMEKIILSGDRIWTDATILPLQNDIPNRKKVIQARLWVYAGGKTKDPPLVLYEYSRTRGQQWPMDKLEHFDGFLQADCYKVYVNLDAKSKLKHVACLAHARRKFYEASVAMNHQGRARFALEKIKAIYRVEHECKLLNDEERKVYRLKHAKPLLDELKHWADEQINLQVTEKGLLGKALYYLIKHWDALTRYLDEGYLKPDNNKAEQHMRPIALGRRNYLFVGSDRGGRAAATFYSLIESCKNYNINPIEYLTDIFTRLPYCQSEEDYQALIPGFWKKL